MKRFLVVLGLVALSVAAVGVAWYARHRAVTPPATPASPQAQLLPAPYLLQEAAHISPDDPVWARIQPVAIPITYQVLMIPWGKSDKGPMQVRAFHNGKTISFRLEWNDSTEDRGGPRVEDLADAVAMMFSLQAEQTSSLMMGFLGRVNIWHWKANWDQDVWAKAKDAPGYADFYPFENDPTFYPARAAGNLRAAQSRATAVEDIVSEGPGSITAKQKQVVQGRGVWREDRWRVVLQRELATREADDFQFVREKKARIAFAAWDGSRGEKGSRKSISEWVWLELHVPPSTAATETGGTPPKERP